MRLARVELGNLGDYRSLRGVIYELRLAFGPGYRIYFGIFGQGMLILLLGGDKSTQRRDIIKAQRYWKDFLMR